MNVKPWILWTFLAASVVQAAEKEVRLEPHALEVLKAAGATDVANSAEPFMATLDAIIL